MTSKGMRHLNKLNAAELNEKLEQDKALWKDFK